jgi:hypothetical protein
VVAIYAIRRGNRNTSAATLVMLNDGFRQAWQRFFAADDNKDHEFSELMNLLEIACGIHKEKSLVGVSRELSQEYLEHVLLLLEANEDARRRIEAAIHTPTTFKYIARFRTKMRRRRSQLGPLESPRDSALEHVTCEAPGPASYE